MLQDIVWIYKDFLEGVPVIIVEKANVRQLIGIVLMGQFLLRQAGSHLPTFPVKVDVRIKAREFSLDFLHGLGVDDAHQVKAEAIKSIDFNPLADRLFDIVADHAAFAGHIIATEGSVSPDFFFIIAVEVSRDNFFKGIGLGMVNMVVDHIHHHADVCIMVGLNGIL